MKRLLGILLAAVAVYFWGFAFWGASSLPYSVWEQTPDDKATQQALRDHFPTNGTYFVPGMNHPPEELESLMQAGPAALVHITHRDGRPVMLPSVMTLGFLLWIVVAALLDMLLRWTALPRYADRVKLATFVGLIAVVMMRLGDYVWWMITIEWKLVQSVHDVVAFGIFGLVLARFSAPRRRSTATPS